MSGYHRIIFFFEKNEVMTKFNIQQVKQRFGIIGNSPELNRAIEIALQVAPTDMSILVMGESGVGKENFPQIIHQFSHRKHGTYIAVNCGSIPEGTIDSELFGHEKGSFTGAIGERRGYFEVANGGTLFLDEVGELPLSTQARLLRVLETGEFIKVGSSKVEKTDVRVVAATNMDMAEATKQGKFREDLYYRLNTVPIRIPALRDRKEDIPLLFRKFASDAAEKYNMPPATLTDAAKDVLMAYRWPGNVRQLKNITEQISILEQSREITADVLKQYLPANEVGLVPAFGHGSSADSKTFANEREILYQVLFDMKNDMAELKKIVSDIISGKIKVDEVKGTPLTTTMPQEHTLELLTKEAVRPTPPINLHDSGHPDIAEAVIEAPIYEEEDEPLSLQEVEKEMIIKALERHNGKRKNAAQDLQISERTLYRKIKEYNLEDL